MSGSICGKLPQPMLIAVLFLTVASLALPPVVRACQVDADCPSGNWCMESTQTCTAKLANGTAMPTDAPHTNPTLNGTCTLAAAIAVCQSGVCDTADNRCGYANGDGPCTSANGAALCRSGACSLNGTCMPFAGCNVNADCSSDNWCMVSTHSCTAKLANGTAIPTEANTNPPLTGVCTVPAGIAVCQSGVCDVSADRCGYQLTIAVIPVGAGTVTPASGSFFDPGQVVGLQAQAAAPYVFLRWSGPVARASDASTTVAMATSQAVTARFGLPALPALPVPVLGGIGLSSLALLIGAATYGWRIARRRDP